MPQLTLQFDIEDETETKPAVVHEPASTKKSSDKWKYSKFNPRDYQELAVDTLEQHWDSGSKGSLLRGATGTGKTPTGCFAIDRWLQRDENNRAIVISHEQELVSQFAEEIRDFLGITPGIEMNRWKVSAGRLPLVTVASRQSLGLRAEIVDGKPVHTSRLYKFSNEFNWLVVVDEAHRYAMKMRSCAHIFQWFEKNPANSRIGLTATPERTDGVSLRRLFPDVAMDFPLFDLNQKVPTAVREGWCVPFDQRFVVVSGFEFKNLAQVRGEFDKDSIEQELGTAKRIEQLCTPMIQQVGTRRTLIFNATVEMARRVSHHLNAKADRKVAEYLHGEIPQEERRDIYQRHQRGEFQFLSVCGLCREGYNDPGIQAIAMFRPTRSRSLAEQMRGRGVRTLRGLVDNLATAEERRTKIAASAKPNCMLVDLVGVTGLADCATTAHILAKGKDDKVIELMNAGAMLAAQNNECINYEKLAKEAEDFIELEKIEAEKKRLRDERLARELDERDAARRAAKLKSEVTYSTEYIPQGEVKGGQSSTSRKKGNKKDKRPTDRQVGYLKVNGIPFDPEKITKSLASRLIGQHKGGMSLDRMRLVNKMPDSGKPADGRQLYFLKVNGIKHSQEITRYAAAKLIVDYLTSPSMADEAPF